MSLISNLTQIDKRYAWSFLGFILAAIFGGITIYTEFIRDNNPEIKTEIIANASILDIKEDIQDLQVIYQDENIKKSQKNLSSILIKLSNTGRNPILSSYYDDSSPFGLQIFNCEIIKAEIVSASNDYLINKLKEKGDKIIGDKFIFPPIIFESDDFVTLKFLLMHPQNQEVKASPVGKVASTKFLKVLETFQQNGKESFWQQVISGSILVHLTRIPVYFIIFIFSIIILFLPPLLIASSIQKRNRKKTVHGYKNLTKLEINEGYEKIFNYYVLSGLGSLTRARKLLNKEEEIPELIAEYQKLEKEGKLTEYFEDLIADNHRPNFRRRNADYIWIVDELIDIGIIELSEENYAINQEAKILLDDFVEFVIIKQS